MNYTNEFLSRCFAAYIDCEAGALDAGLPLNKMFFGKIELLNSYHFIACLRNKTNHTFCFDIKHCKLILKSLSEISDEDAIEVAKIEDKITEFMHRGRRIEITKYEFVKTKLEDKIFIGIQRYYKEHNYGYSPLPLIASLYNSEQIDFLRSCHYDCGFMDIPSLIEAGIAIIEPLKTDI